MGGGGGLQPTLASIQANIFTPTCALSSCHQSPGQQGLILEPGLSWGNLFNVVSPQDAAATCAPGGSGCRVRPGDPDGSFLIHKLEGMLPGGGQIVGNRMPDGGASPLQQVTIQVIKEWILNGAPQ